MSVGRCGVSMLVALRAVELREQGRGDSYEAVDEHGIEVDSALRAQLAKRPVEWPGLLVGPLAYKGVEDVAEAADTGGQRYLGTTKPHGVAGAIPAFVVASASVSASRTTGDRESLRIVAPIAA